MTMRQLPLRRLPTRSRWDYTVRTYARPVRMVDGRPVLGQYQLMLETVHQGEHSRDMETKAGLACGRDVFVYDIKSGKLIGEYTPWARGGY